MNTTDPPFSLSDGWRSAPRLGRWHRATAPCANPSTGTGSYAIPIPAPDARGFGPSLALAYDSGSGNGPFGLGWSLSLGAITRRTDRQLPLYDGGDGDVFVLSGAEDLVPQHPPPAEDPAEPYGVIGYRPRTEAVAANQIPQRYGREGEIDAALVRWVQAAAAWTLEARTNPCGLGELLTVAGVAEAPDRTSFAQQLCGNEAAMPAFWDGLTGTFDKPRIQLTFQWWSLARGHLPLIENLEARRDAETEETLLDLAKFSEVQWRGILEELSTGAPPTIPGDGDEQRKDNYAKVLYATMATAFPTKVFAHRVDAEEASYPAIQAFFGAHAAFEFGKDRLSKEPYLATVAAMSDSDRKRIQKMERLFRLAPTYETTSALIAHGYDSSHSIHAKGKSKFVTEMEMVESIGAAGANEIFKKACWLVGASSAAFAQFGLSTHKLQIHALPNIGTLSSELAVDIPDWHALFGNAGGCSCKHCAGVLGPAAYLTDSLVWLDGFDSEVMKDDPEKWTALDVLVGSDEEGDEQPLGRRPDLKVLELTCKSAHTPQPYIDLVNELLELAVAKDAGVDFDSVEPIKTTFEPEELAAGPEILYEVAHIGAWRSLMERRHPFTLPVCLFDRESEAYLAYLGVTRADIVETLGGNEDNLTKARLGVRDDVYDAPANPLLSGWKMLVSTESTGTAAEHWGLPPEATLPYAIQPVPAFLKQSGLTFTELEELLATRYVNGDDGMGAGSLPALVLDPDDGCDAAAMTLPALINGHLLRLHRFLRLRLHTGLSSTDLDLLIAAFSEHPVQIMFTEALLAKITGALALAKDLKLSVREVAGLFADLDIHERWEKKSPYRQYFLNRLVESPEPAVFADVLAPGGSTASLTPYKTVLQQALGISEKDLRLLVDGDALAAELLLPPTEIIVDDFAANTAILPRVSELWRHVRFAGALGLRLADYLVLRAYSGLTPIGVCADLAHTRAFVELVRTVQAQKLTVADLQWILRAFAPSSTGLSPHAADIEALRVEIASALQALESETEMTEDAVGTDDETGDTQTRAFALLDELLGATERDGVMEVLRGLDYPPDPPSDAPFNVSLRAKLAPIANYLPGSLLAEPEDAMDLLAGVFTPAVPPEDSVQSPPLLKSADERFAYAAKWLDRHIRGSRIVAEKIAAATGLSSETITYLVTSVLKSQVVTEPPDPPNEHPLIADFLLAKRPGATEEHQTTGLGLVLRHARLIAGLRVGEPSPPAPDGSAGGEIGELSWVYPPYPEPPAVEDPPFSPLLRELPAEQPSTASISANDLTRFAQIIALVRRVGLRDRMSGGPDALREYYEALPDLVTEFPSEPGPLQSLLAEKSGWDLAAITALCGPLGIVNTGAQLEELPSDANLLKLEKAVALVRRLGIDPAEVLAFSDLEALPPAAAENGLQPTTGSSKNARDLVLLARRAAKAKLTAEQWQQVAKKIRDPFRELLRDRLVDALVPSVHATRNDLYGFHLIDVDMNACMMTSRIVQATNALQIFVQRSFLGLDAQVKLPDHAGKQWQWRSSYRVWEANRKVFLWPENWLEPELRDDMTPLFRDFLTNLSSGEITDASAERALEKYLTGLHEVARLEPMALWYDYETKTDHVVARTRSQPRKWFYRRREGNASWTAWEKMDVDIDAESALLVGANRRIYLLWPQVALKSDPRLGPTTLNPAHPGLVPGQELGESDEDYDERLADYTEQLVAWGKSVGLQPPESEPETTYHYEVRVAWSSYVAGAWTSKKLSDCTPLRVSSAKGDGEAGYEPHHIVFVAEPKNTLVPQGAVHVACVVTASSLSPKNIVAGRFYFDACGGGRWTSKSIEGQVYYPTQPGDSTLSRAGFREVKGGGAFSIRHVPPGKTSLQTVFLLGDHEGEFFIVSPSRYGTHPTHTFDRFLFTDHRAVFHGRALATTGNWTAASSFQPGEYAGMEDAGELSVPQAILGGSEKPELATPTPSTELYELELFEHPHVCEFANRLAAKGAAGLLGWKETPLQSAQYLGYSIPEYLSDIYQPTAHVLAPFPMQDVSFEFGSAYGMYNWELFFHVPFTIAQRLSQEGRHAEAQKWYHFIFNPTSGVNAPGPRRFWCVRPFHEIPDLATIDENLADLAAASSFAAALKALVAADETTQKAADAMTAQIGAMAAKPFAPHVLARMRPLAYMKNVFMRYLQNLLDWADSLFRRDTMESIHEALTLYLLAAELLGPRPEIIEHKADPEGKTFKQLLEAGIDAFGNAAVDVENIVPKQVAYDFQCEDDKPTVPDFRLYFCIPPNDHLYGAWDMVADRLFKIRNCMNIDGVVRSLALFAPPIDPALLVKATAAGVSLDDVLNALAAPAPLYRFVRLHAKAMEFAGAVQSLGQAALAAWERKDGEELALLRQRQEREVLAAERELRKEAIQEARETLAGLNRSRESAEARLQYYTELLDKGLLQQEKSAETNTRRARSLRRMAMAVNEVDTFLSGVPDISLGIAAASTIGGRALQQATGAISRKLSADADSANTDASLAQTAAGYARRAQEWKLQKSVGEKEVAQLEKQIIAQEIRLAMAERELANLDLRREHSSEIDTFFRSKFTNQQLYTWMVDQVRAEHQQAYHTAYDMAKKAERAYQLERGDDKTFIQFGAWDKLKQGLLAGERLLRDLRALDAAYLLRSDREREITKHVALSEIAGEQLTQLRDTGKAVLELQTHHFDADYPGHYFRRIKTVAISVATVRPAADGVQCELTLLQSSIRKTSQVTEDIAYPGHPYGQPEPDPAHRYSLAAVKGLVTSTAENDPGLFELSLKDEMLLPFEGSGVVSQWRIEIDPKTNRFPLHRISDVKLHLRYTAKDGGAALRSQALAYAERAETPDPGPEDPPNGLKQRTRVFSARHDFDEAWALFTKGTLSASDTWVNRLELRFAQRHFQSFFGNPKVKIVKIQVSATFNEKYEPPIEQDGSVDYTLARSTPLGTVTFVDSLAFRAGEPKAFHDVESEFEMPDPEPDPAPPPPLPFDVMRDDADGFVPWIFEAPVPVEPAVTPAYRLDEEGHYLLRPDAFEDIWFIVTYEAQS